MLPLRLKVLGAFFELPKIEDRGGGPSGVVEGRDMYEGGAALGVVEGWEKSERVFLFFAFVVLGDPRAPATGKRKDMALDMLPQKMELRSSRSLRVEVFRGAGKWRLGHSCCTQRETHVTRSKCSPLHA